LFLYASIQGISGPLWPLKQTLPADIIGFEGFVHVTKYAGKMRPLKNVQFIQGQGRRKF
jgi:hypothetical protein